VAFASEKRVGCWGSCSIPDQTVPLVTKRGEIKDDGEGGLTAVLGAGGGGRGMLAKSSKLGRSRRGPSDLLGKHRSTPESRGGGGGGSRLRLWVITFRDRVWSERGSTGGPKSWGCCFGRIKGRGEGPLWSHRESCSA